MSEGNTAVRAHHQTPSVRAAWRALADGDPFTVSSTAWRRGSASPSWAARAEGPPGHGGVATASGFALFGMNVIARSASAEMVSAGFTPGFADTALPSMT